jgi:hypothetical protein
LRQFKILFRNLVYGWITLLLLGSSVLPPADKLEKVRAYTRGGEFDYIEWTLDALYVKAAEFASVRVSSLPDSDQEKFVLSYLELVDRIDQVNAVIENIYSNPDIKNPKTAALPDIEKRNSLLKNYSQVAPVAENILEQQTSAVLKDIGLTFAGQPIPPVLYHISPLPKSLIISPREQIQQDANISLKADITLEQMIDLEGSVEKALNVSALVEDIGGVGTYPTMVMSTTDLPYLADTVAHEWTHNFLTLRPLGVNYETTPELRTMNETAASIAGSEISELVLKRFYPDTLPPPVEASTPAASQGTAAAPPQNAPPVFNYRKEMHATRVHVDELLKQKKIDEAEQYMEARRRVFWDQGYEIRRLNQAYFAFHGAYADLPGGAAGNDPVGPAVRKLRQQSPSLAAFLNRISWMTSFEQLQKAVQ